VTILARIYTRKITPSEAKYGYITIVEEAKDMFPGQWKGIRLYFKGKLHDLQVDGFYRIWLGKMKSLLDLKEGLTVEIERDPHGAYAILVRN